MEIKSAVYEWIPPRLLPWFEENRRPLPWRDNADPYRVWLSEIMLQQTRIEAVKPYFERFLSALPDIAALADASEEQVLKLWEGLGYYSRARNLRKAAQRIMERHGGVFPPNMEDIRALPGIGAYTAGAVGSIAFGLREPAVDGNVLRVVARIAGSKADVMKDSVRREVSAGLRAVYPEGRASDFTQGLMELGEIVCLPDGAPRCAACPMRDVCRAAHDRSWTSIPVRGVKKGRRQEKRTVLILRSGNLLALRKRPETGLLASLWELPSLDGWKTKEELRDATGCAPVRKGPDAKHVFTHLEWHMRSWIFELPEPSGGYQWFEREKLPAVPAAFRAFLDESEKGKKK